MPLIKLQGQNSAQKQENSGKNIGNTGSVPLFLSDLGEILAATGEPGAEARVLMRGLSLPCQVVPSQGT
jgi:hypothetical protein